MSTPKLTESSIRRRQPNLPEHLPDTLRNTFLDSRLVSASAENMRTLLRLNVVVHAQGLESRLNPLAEPFVSRVTPNNPVDSRYSWRNPRLRTRTRHTSHRGQQSVSVQVVAPIHPPVVFVVNVSDSSIEES